MITAFAHSEWCTVLKYCFVEHNTSQSFDASITHIDFGWIQINTDVKIAQGGNVKIALITWHNMETKTSF